MKKIIFILIAALVMLNVSTATYAANKPAAYVACADHTSYAIDENGTLWAWGYGENYMLGDGMSFGSSSPVIIMNSVAKVSARGEHALALKKDGSVWEWGVDYSKTLVEGKLFYKTKPTKVLSGAKDIAAGGTFSLALLQNGTLCGWGSNKYGQIIGTKPQYSKPQIILKNADKISAGDEFAMAIVQGKLYAWGNNDFGQLGTAAKSNTPNIVLDGIKAISCGRTHAAALNSSGDLFIWGDWNSFDEDALTKPVLTGIADVAAGETATYITKTDGTVWSCLYPGQSSDPVKLANKASSIAAGTAHTMIVSTEGILYVKGNNTFGQLGNGSTENAEKFTALELKETAPVKEYAPYGKVLRVNKRPDRNLATLQPGVKFAEIVLSKKAAISEFVYPSIESAQRDAGGVSKDGTHITCYDPITGGETFDIVFGLTGDPGRYYLKDNVIVYYGGKDKATLNLLTNIFGRPFAGG